MDRHRVGSGTGTALGPTLLQPSSCNMLGPEKGWGRASLPSDSQGEGCGISRAVLCAGEKAVQGVRLRGLTLTLPALPTQDPGAGCSADLDLLRRVTTKSDLARVVDQRHTSWDNRAPPWGKLCRQNKCARMFPGLSGLSPIAVPPSSPGTPARLQVSSCPRCALDFRGIWQACWLQRAT